MKKVSVITVNYNNADGLKRTLESLFAQTFTDYESIVIDGGSTDGSREIIENFADRITYWVSEPDGGIYHAMNKGIRQATGLYYNFMNSGDLFEDPTVLENIFASDPTEDILFGKNASERHPKGDAYPTPITMLTLYKTHPNHQASFLRRTLFNDHLYDETYRIASDWKFFIECLIFRQCSYAHLDVIVARYDQTGISSVNQKLYEEEREQILHLLLPDRIYADYIYLGDADSPLLKLTPYFNRTRGFQQLIYGITYALIRFRSLFVRELGQLH